LVGSEDVGVLGDVDGVALADGFVRRIVLDKFRIGNVEELLVDADLSVYDICQK
jgi:hypothetical protein